MEIKGKILLHKSLYKTVVGEEGFLSTEAFAFFEDKLYLNLTVNFFSKSIEPFLIPFKRTSTDQDGFKIDFEVAGVSFVTSLFQPQENQGWIGPYDFEKSDFTWDNFYRKFSHTHLYDLYLNSSNSSEYLDAKSVFKIYKEKLLNYLDSLSLDLLNEEQEEEILEKKDLTDYYESFQEEEQKDEKYFDYAFEIINFKINLIESKIKSFSKEVPLENMNKEKLKLLLQKVINEGNFEKAAEIRDLLQKKV
jgi:protein-arginine kinase activator protein McsA